MMETGEALMVPVVASALRNMSHFVLRPVDARWNYSGAIPKNLTGFNPLTFRVYLPEISFIAAYLGKGKCDEPLRPAWLDYELLYAVHDYIHVRVMEEAAAFFPSRITAVRADCYFTAFACRRLLPQSALTTGISAVLT
jgi:hypothetical protein